MMMPGFKREVSVSRDLDVSKLHILFLEKYIVMIWRHLVLLLSSLLFSPAAFFYPLA